MTLEIKKLGRRWLVTGTASFHVRDRLRAYGCKWDPESKTWWTGSPKVATAIESQIPALIALAGRVVGGAAPAPVSRPRAPDRWADYEPSGPCGYPGCSYNHCDECDGWGSRS